MTEKRDKVNVDDIIGLIKTDEPTDSVTLKKEAQLNICERKLLDMEEDRDYYKTKSASLEEGYIKLQKENEQLKSICQDHRDHAIDFKADCARLEKENEQLKKELGKFKEWEKHTHDVRREDLDRVFKMSIYEIAEAFEYYQERIKKLEKELKE